MKEPATKDTLFHVYFKDWVDLYKAGGVREVTLGKYYISHQRLIALVPTLTLSHIDRKMYQSLLNEYALTHERQTTMDFHHQLKACIMDALAEGLIPRDPTRKAVIKGKSPADKKTKFLSQFELHAILNDLDLGE